MKYPLALFLSIYLLSGASDSGAAMAQVNDAPPISGVLGHLVAVTSDSVDVQTKNGLVHVKIDQPLTIYKQVRSDLSQVTPSSYVGIPSVKQSNGKEEAQLVLIFPPELRGAAEGSVITNEDPGAATESRMTNGTVSRPVPSASRMTNGTVQKGGSATLVLSYQDGSQTISVPPNVPVNKVAPVKATLAAGDTIYAATTTEADGTLATNKIFIFIAATSRAPKK
jgi:hypothetical protein